MLAFGILLSYAHISSIPSPGGPGTWQGTCQDLAGDVQKFVAPHTGLLAETGPGMYNKLSPL